MPLAQPQAIRTIFFDVGFTLLKPYLSTPEICQQVSRRLDLHIHLDDVSARMTEAEEYFYRQIHSNRHAWASQQAIDELWIGYYMNLLRPFLEERDERRLYELARQITLEYAEHTSWQVFPDVEPVLEALKKQNYSLGVISDWGIELGPILRKHRLTRYFDFLLISAVTRHAKPSPTLYELALQRADAIADYSLHVGDSYIYDVLGARTVGITPVLLDRQRLLRPEEVDCELIYSLDELLDLLEVPRA